MTTFIGRFTPGQLAQLTSRSSVTEKQASSATGTLVAGDDPGEVYLDDVNALFVTNGIDSGDIVEITVGTLPLGEYTVSALYFDPAVPAAEQVPFETRLILDGFPTLGGPITYRVLAATEILEEVAQLTQSVSRVDNIIKPELQALDDIFFEFEDQFDRVCDFVADTYRQLAGTDRDRVDNALIDASAALVTPTVLFPLGYAGLQPDRSTIDPYTIGFASSEQEGKNEEVAAEPASSGGPLLVAYTDALTKEDNALIAQDAALALLEAEIADNDTTAEAGDLDVLYTDMSAIAAAQRSSIADRRQDIADIVLADDTRPNVGGLNFGTFALLQTELDARKAELLSAPFHATFLDKRFIYLDSLVNRAFGTRSDLVALTTQVSISADRRDTLVAESVTARQLLQLP
jgi:hypothetical protein